MKAYALVKMLNQIAEQFSCLGDRAAINATAGHIKSFWDPRMIVAIHNLNADQKAELSPIAAASIATFAASDQ